MSERKWREQYPKSVVYFLFVLWPHPAVLKLYYWLYTQESLYSWKSSWDMQNARNKTQVGFMQEKCFTHSKIVLVPHRGFIVIPCYKILDLISNKL